MIQIDVLLSRDLDSLASPREALAVHEFLQDDESQVHVMRDHPHHGVNMLGKSLLF
jgi:hypothetical protein